MKLLLILALYAILPSSAKAQTAIIYYRVQDTLFVGADSRVANANYTRFDTACKIIPFKHFFYAFAGYSIEDSLQQVVSYFGDAKNISDAASLLLRSRYKALSSRLTSLYHFSNDFYVKNYHRHKYTEIILFGIEANRITSRQITFNLVSSPTEIPKIDTANLDISSNLGTHTSGHTNAIEDNLSNSAIWTSGIKIGIEKLIAIQSKATPNDVSLPLDIILLTKNGAQWVCPTGACYSKYHTRK